MEWVAREQWLDPKAPKDVVGVGIWRERVESSRECFLLFPTEFLFSRAEAITLACVLSKQTQEQEGLRQHTWGWGWGLVGGFLFISFSLFQIVPERSPET